MQPVKAILITGARKGIGRYLAEYYLDRGHTVLGCSRSASDLQAKRYEHFCVDITDEGALRSMFSAIHKRHGALDALINNAGIAAMNHSLLTPANTVSALLAVNLVGTFLCCREAARSMQRHKFGRIVNFSTVAVPLRLEGEAVYAASKGAVETLTRVLARELAPWGITVNAIGPTPLQTDLIKSVPQEKIDALIERQAIKRMGRLADVSHTIDFLIDEHSDFITGQIIYLGGV